MPHEAAPLSVQAMSTAPPPAGEGPPSLAIDGAVATIHLRRPSQRNSLHDVDLHTLLCHFAQLDADAAVRVVVLSAATEGQRTWFEVVSAAKWKTRHDIKARFARASFVGENRVVFNIEGNAYRLVVAVAYVLGAMYIKFVGTHEEYDAINVSTVEPKP